MVAHTYCISSTALLVLHLFAHMKRDWRSCVKNEKRASNPAYFITSAQLANCCVKWVWMLDWQFCKVTKIVWHSCPNADIGKAWVGVFRLCSTIWQTLCLTPLAPLLLDCRESLNTESSWTQCFIVMQLQMTIRLFIQSEATNATQFVSLISNINTAIFRYMERHVA